MENNIPWRLVRSRRRTIAIQISPQGEVTVRAPMGMPMSAVEEFVRCKADWIQAHLPQNPSLPPLTEEEHTALVRRAKAVLPERTAWFARRMGVQYGTITVRSQHTRWGSCSSKGNLSFNCLLMLAPPEVVDYVVVHELCHLTEMNHSRAFWELVEQTLPDYRIPRRWLKDHGPALIARLSKGETE